MNEINSGSTSLRTLSARITRFLKISLWMTKCKRPVNTAKRDAADFRGGPLCCQRYIITVVMKHFEVCPLCGETSAVRPKLVLIDEAWLPAPGKDPRLAYFADLRVDDVQPKNLREQPLEQFIDGFYCDRVSAT
jgi:hypothetical protein